MNNELKAVIEKMYELCDSLSAKSAMDAAQAGPEREQLKV